MVNDKLIETYSDHKLADNISHFEIPARNEVTKEKIYAVKLKADNYKLPKILGNITNHEYSTILNLLLNSTMETRHRLLFYQKETLPNLKNFNNFLDVGPASGRLTKLNGRNFSRIKLIDTNSEVLEKFKQSAFKRCIKLEKVHTSILYASLLPEEQFDLISISHVLYHIPNRYWLDLIKRLYSFLSPKGKLIIVLNGSQDKSTFCKHFGGIPVNIIPLYKLCRMQLPYDVQLHYSNEFLKAYDSLTLMKMLSLFLFDTFTTANFNNVLDWVNKYYKKENQLYELYFRQYFLVITKV